MQTQPIEYVFLGVKGHVIALNRANGTELWRAQLKGSDYVNAVLDGDQVIATTKGEVFCLRAANGQLIWHNRLSGFGTGLVTVATSRNPGGRFNDFERRRKEQQAAAATAAVVASS